MVDRQFDPQRILDALVAADVRFVLIGGMAAILHGDAGVTLDVDLAPAFDDANLDRLAAALRSLDARIRVEEVPDGLPFDCSGAFLRNLGSEAILNLTSCAGDVDVTFKPAGTGGFQDLRRDSVLIDLSGTTVRVASLADIIRSKAAADREKDRAAVPRLRRLLERTDRDRR